VVDALDAEQVERLPDVVGSGLLARMGDAVEPLGCRHRVHLLEERWRVADLGRVERDADELVAERQGGAEGLLGSIRPEVTQERQQDVGGDAERLSGLLHRSGEAGEDDLERHAVVDVGLRVEEELRPPDASRRGSREVAEREVVEVTLRAQHREVRVVHVEERLQVGEHVARGELGRVVGRQAHAVAPRGGDEELRFDRALDVDVQF
jgi:hypothetical protein